jgi:hypothetical protein
VLGEHFARPFKSEMKLEVEPTYEWYEFDIRKDGKKYILHRRGVGDVH